MRKIIIFIGFLIFLNQNPAYGQYGIIKGVIFDSRNKALPGVEIRLIGTKIISNSYADLKGKFIINNILPGIYTLQAKSIICGDTTLSNLEVLTGTKLKLKLFLPSTCIYRDNQNNKTCPICGKRNKVVPILYGLPIGGLDEDNYYYAGCEITCCDPNWYCKRDKFKF